MLEAHGVDQLARVFLLGRLQDRARLVVLHHRALLHHQRRYRLAQEPVAARPHGDAALREVDDRAVAPVPRPSIPRR